MLKNQCKLYADECQLIGIFKEKKDIEQIQIDINVLQKWAKTWQISFNYDSCKVRHFGKRGKVTFIVKVFKRLLATFSMKNFDYFGSKFDFRSLFHQKSRILLPKRTKFITKNASKKGSNLFTTFFKK